MHRIGQESEENVCSPVWGRSERYNIKGTLIQYVIDFKMTRDVNVITKLVMLVLPCLWLCLLRSLYKRVC